MLKAYEVIVPFPCGHLIKCPLPVNSHLPSPVFSASQRARHAYFECVSTCILSAMGTGEGVCGSLLGKPAAKQRKSNSASCTWWIYSGTQTGYILDTLPQIYFACLSISWYSLNTFSLYNVITRKLGFIQFYGWVKMDNVTKWHSKLHPIQGLPDCQVSDTPQKM